MISRLCGVALPILAIGLCSASVSAQDVARGTALVADARKVLGGESRLAGVKTLHVTGTFRRVVGTNDTDGDFEVFLERPDKYLRSEKTGTPGQPSSETIEALVGAEVRDLVRGGGGGRGGRGGAIGGGGADADAAPEAPADVGTSDARDGGQPGDPTAAAGGGRPSTGLGAGGRGAADAEARRRARQADVARLLLMFLLASDVPTPWVGIAESPDGKADVVEARFADGQPTRLFVDVASHMPLMMQWQGVPARTGGAAGRRGGGGGRGRGDADAGPPGEPGAPRSGAQAPVTFEMTFSDHRAVNGVRLPHVITKGTDGKTTERWAIRSYRVNPSFNAETFTR